MDDALSPKPPQEPNQPNADAATFGKPEVQPLAEETQQKQDQPIADAASGIPEISDIEMADARRTLRTVRRPINEAEQSNPAADNARQRLIQSQQQAKMHALSADMPSKFFHRFLVMARTDNTLKRISPTIRQLCLQSLLGKDEDVSCLPQTDHYLVKVKNKQQSDMLLQQKSLKLTNNESIPIEFKPHWSLNYTKGVIFDKRSDLQDLNNGEIQEALSDQGVVKVDRIQPRQNKQNHQKPGSTYFLTFLADTAPPRVKVGCDTFHVKEYDPKPRLCQKCLLYGHGTKKCRGKDQCKKCLGQHATESCDNPTATQKCKHCKLEHMTGDTECARYKLEHEIQKVLHRDHLTIVQAREKVNSYWKKENSGAQSYATTAATSNQVKTVTASGPTIYASSSSGPTIAAKLPESVSTTSMSSTSGGSTGVAPSLSTNHDSMVKNVIQASETAAYKKKCQDLEKRNLELEEKLASIDRALATMCRMHEEKSVKVVELDSNQETTQEQIDMLVKRLDEQQEENAKERKEQAETNAKLQEENKLLKAKLAKYEALVQKENATQAPGSSKPNLNGRKNSTSSNGSVKSNNAKNSELKKPPVSSQKKPHIPKPTPMKPPAKQASKKRDVPDTSPEAVEGREPKITKGSDMPTSHDLNTSTATKEVDKDKAGTSSSSERSIDPRGHPDLYGAIDNLTKSSDKSDDTKPKAHLLDDGKLHSNV